MLIPPTENDIFNYTAATHAADRIPLATDAIKNTWAQKGMPNPYAQGHFRAFMYILHKLLVGGDFPAKNPEMIKTLSDSHAALFWLREIHHKMTDPLIGHPFLEDDPNAPQQGQAGKYRLTPAMSVTIPAPPADTIPRLMHVWLIQYAKLHDKIKDKIENPYGFSQELGREVIQKVTEANLFFITVQPLSCLNQRMGRFIENTFRLAWRLPMKFYYATSDEYRDLPHLIEKYQKETLPQLVKDALAVKG
jgi:hypothetical protein